ncbi:MAG: S-layer homology domain-containing protein [Candidatus Ancillula sp.]|jgi:hypothetical protein|nr:S-layer homology domain-containing protein [Candidatus Ancillula sp.]
MSDKIFSLSKKIGVFLSSMAMVLTVALVSVTFGGSGNKANAASSTYNGDLFLGVFQNGDNDESDYLYTSTDGVNFEQIATAYKDKHPNVKDQNVYSTKGGTHMTQTSPSIMYYNGYFWMISSWLWSPDRSKFWPMIAVSKDCKTWSWPEGQLFNGSSKSYGGISLDQKPSIPNYLGTSSSNFDTVAPEWFLDSNGTPYIVFSAGRYGEFHGKAEDDQMQPYYVKVNKLSVTGSVHGSSFTQVNFKASKAYKITSVGTEDRIDGSIYKEGKYYYLVIKRHGLYNEIWRNTSMAKSGWKRVDNNITTGFEAPVIQKMNGTYYLYSDRISTYMHGVEPGTNGTFVFSSNKINGKYTNLGRIQARNKSGKLFNPRQGSVMKVTDPTARARVLALRAKAGYPSIVFPDVAGWDGANADIAWLSKSGVTTGIPTKYGAIYNPKGTVSRLAMVLFLYRLAGQPTVSSTDMAALKKLKDVSKLGKDDQTAIAWALSKGITNGNKGKFLGSNTCSRVAMALFMYRMAGQPKYSSSHHFSDIKGFSSDYKKAIEWMYKTGVTTGIDAKHKLYAPSNPCSRAQMASFLHRYSKIK